jgi:hypothetical protein
MDMGDSDRCIIVYHSCCSFPRPSPSTRIGHARMQRAPTGLHHATCGCRRRAGRPHSHWSSMRCPRATRPCCVGYKLRPTVRHRVPRGAHTGGIGSSCLSNLRTVAVDRAARRVGKCDCAAARRRVVARARRERLVSISCPTVHVTRTQSYVSPAQSVRALLRSEQLWGNLTVASLAVLSQTTADWRGTK